MYDVSVSRLNTVVILWSNESMTMSFNQNIIYLLMSGSCHLENSLTVEIGVECQIFVILIFFNCSRVLQFGAHSRYYNGALTQKRSFSYLIFMSAKKNQNKHSTLISSFDALLSSTVILNHQKIFELSMPKFDFNSQDLSTT